MTDYEVNKRLAEIMGFKEDSRIISFVYGERQAGDAFDGVRPARGQRFVWNPLKDWSQLGLLIERFGASVEYDPPYGNVWWSYMSDTEGRHGFGEGPEPKRAMCLAIIAAHEGSTV